jgi:glycerol uptake facilitator-like aquaporin
MSHTASPSLPTRLFAEFLGTAALLAVVIGSGIMAERLAGGNVAIALLGNTLATVFGLYVLIELLGPVSGAHFNPCVSLVEWAQGSMKSGALALYITAQLLGSVAGACLSNAMFDMEIWQFSTKVRAGWGQWLAEAVATAGLLLVILRGVANRAAAAAEGHAASAAPVSALVASYIGAAYWFTASTSFANPAAAFGRMFSDSFAGIAPASAPAFVAAQLVGAAVGVGLARALATR